MNNVYVVPQELVYQAWNKYGDLLAKAIKHSKGDLTEDQLRMSISQGKHQIMLFITDDVVIGAVAFCWINSPNDRIFYTTALAGKTTKDHAEAMFDYAKHNGATVVRGAARESVARLWRMKYGFNEIYRIVEKRL